jgi:hypothetical protein
MSAVVAVHNAVAPATATDIKAHVQRIQQVMRAVMKDKTHYGVIPGTPKPSLWKPGAEVLCATFHIAPSYRVDDLSDHDCIRYRVTCMGTHQGTGVVLGEGMGEASSNEEKYKWRKASGRREFENADESRRRVKYGWDKQRSQEYEIQQVRTEPADVANTILKMACKRAQVAMTLNVTAASDCFTQDLEDMPEELREQHNEEQPRAKPQTQTPQATSPSGKGTTGAATEKQIKLIRAKLDNAGLSAEQLCAKFAIESVTGLPFDKVNEALAWIQKGGDVDNSDREPGSDG